MRLFVVPIFKNHWGYHCQTSVLPSGRLARWVDYASTKWEGLSAAKPNSWKFRLYTSGSNLMDKIDYHEWFLKSVPPRNPVEDRGRMPVICPATLDTDEVQTKLTHLITQRKPYHQRYLTLSCLWLPLSLAFSLVPLVPNVFLFYNLFRVYSHYRAYQGADHLLWLLHNNQVDFTGTDPIFQAREALFRVTDEDPLSVASIHQLSHELDMPLLEVNLLRAHNQILDRASEAGEYTPSTDGDSAIDVHSHPPSPSSGSPPLDSVDPDKKKV
ncbi:hypothetical protein H4R33_000210 [Dimargaris cristalligena]|uniref:Mitochondrial K+-H+ exchange-related-domain-containing protein n=1 Tax=Dimargaris cristalligena TaxID=215637 RepID=A0A4Q0A041_9FUNG|nr:hypothetical protein H4R33_000210 [Dimargaris cristalligena]RKP38612.1 mitochondrial K+-H+ exchange-related-domain-containing protein [Dimargaris cristalligena]|eukprot:RKP38612.1 mitochondrial K+-H+ exchange-related-domain-containing protein [Dimargaris cristalligena]